MGDDRGRQHDHKNTHHFLWTREVIKNGLHFSKKHEKHLFHFNHAEILGSLPSGRVPKKWLVFFWRKMKKIRFSLENAENFRFSHWKCYTDLTAMLLSSHHFWKCNAFYDNPDHPFLHRLSRIRFKKFFKKFSKNVENFFKKFIKKFWNHLFPEFLLFFWKIFENRLHMSALLCSSVLRISAI